MRLELVRTDAEEACGCLVGAEPSRHLDIKRTRHLGGGACMGLRGNGVGHRRIRPCLSGRCASTSC